MKSEQMPYDMTDKTTMRLCGIDILRGLAAFGIVGSLGGVYPAVRNSWVRQACVFTWCIRF